MRFCDELSLIRTPRNVAPLLPTRSGTVPANLIPHGTSRDRRQDRAVIAEQTVAITIREENAGCDLQGLLPLNFLCHFTVTLLTDLHGQTIPTRGRIVATPETPRPVVISMAFPLFASHAPSK